jgi:hypothetical protein
VAAVYDDPAATDHSVLFFGGTASIVNPEQSLDKTLSLVNDQGDAIDGLHAVDAGALGGVFKCGTTTGDAGTMAVCGWADNGSLGAALFPGRTVDQAANLMLTMRTGIEHRS